MVGEAPWVVGVFMEEAAGWMQVLLLYFSVSIYAYVCTHTRMYMYRDIEISVYMCDSKSN